MGDFREFEESGINFKAFFRVVEERGVRRICAFTYFNRNLIESFGDDEESAYTALKGKVWQALNFSA